MKSIPEVADMGKWIPCEDLSIKISDALRRATYSPDLVFEDIDRTVLSANGTICESFVCILSLSNALSVANLVFLITDFLHEARRSSRVGMHYILLVGKDPDTEQKSRVLVEEAIGILHDELAIPARYQVDLFSNLVESLGKDNRSICLGRTRQTRISSADLDEDLIINAYANLSPRFIYLANHYMPGKALRSAGIRLISPPVQGRWEDLFTRCPSFAKQPPFGACFRGAMMFTMELKDSLGCACHTSHEMLDNLLRRLGSCLRLTRLNIPREGGLKPYSYHIHRPASCSKLKRYGVLLFGSPSMSLSNLALVSIACKISRELSLAYRPLLVVDDISPCYCYQHYDSQLVKAFYNGVASLFEMELAFASDDPLFHNRIQAWLEAKTLGDLIQAIPQGRASRKRGTITVWDAMHLASMAATWNVDKDVGLVLHAKNMRSINSICSKHLSSFISCHSFHEYDLRFHSAEEISVSIKSEFENLSRTYNPIAFRNNMIAVGLLHVQEVAQATHNKIGIATSWTTDIQGGGVSMSVRNSLAAFNKTGTATILQGRAQASSWDELPMRIDYNYSLNNELGGSPDLDFVLCIDFDGYTVTARRNGGKYLKIVQIRTNFSEILDYEIGPFGECVRKMALLQQRNLQDADGIVFSSMHTCEMLRARVPDNTPYCIVPNGVDEDLLMHRGGYPDVKIGTPLVLALGSFYRRKAFDILIRASITLFDQGTDHQLLLVGSGPERHLYDQMINGYNHIQIMPFTSCVDELSRLYELSSIVCHPSLQEDFGNIYLEAGVMSKPVVAADIQAAREIIIDGKTGLFFCPGSPSSLASRLRFLLNNSAVRRKYGHNAKQFALKYTWLAYARGVVAFAKSLA